MHRYVISAPRSGLNWTRFCVERFYGVKTPGKTVLLETTTLPTFTRSHDALGRNGRGRNRSKSYQIIDLDQTRDARVLLILRDPQELYIRAYKGSRKRFRGFIGNIQFYSRSLGEKQIAYYDELITQPEAMWSALKFLDISVAEGLPKPSPKMLAAEWQASSQKSRSLYDVTHIKSGGATTAKTPTDFKYHQRKMSDAERIALWHDLDQTLTDDELALIARYRPADLPDRVTWPIRAQASWHRLRRNVRRAFRKRVT